MGDHVSVYGRFRAAIERGNLIEAEAAARELPTLSLSDALDYCDLLAQREPAKYERAALRWHSRLEREREGLTFSHSLLALASLQALPQGDRGTPLAFLRYLAKSS